MPLCLKCNSDLKRVLQASHGMLNEDQFDSVRAGDWYCDNCTGDRGKSGHRYFWKREIDAARWDGVEPIPEDADGGRCAPDEITGKIVVHLTVDQINDLTAILRKSHTGGVVPDPVPQWAPAPGTHHNALMYGKKCKELEAKLKITTEGLTRISNGNFDVASGELLSTAMRNVVSKTLAELERLT